MLDRRSARTLAGAAGAFFILASACSASIRPPQPPGSAAPSPAEPAAAVVALATATPSAPPLKPLPPTPEPTPSPTGGVLAETLTETLDRSSFGDPTTIDNIWFPMPPGSQLVLQGKANVDEGRVSRKVVITVTDLTKVIDGVRSRVVYELDYTAGELEEAELSFFAQDDDGAVWLMGEYPEEYDGGKFDKAPTWISGLHDARAGILMKAAPTIGGLSYAEGWGPAVGWNDRAKVFETNSVTCVPAGCYDGVLVIDEFNRDEPDAHQLKYYAGGVGTVRVGWAGSREGEQETLQLTKFVHLGPALLAQIRDKALALDRHGYRVSKGVYAQTPPIELPSTWIDQALVGSGPQLELVDHQAELPARQGAGTASR